jgi:hypothetical protein
MGIPGFTAELHFGIVNPIRWLDSNRKRTHKPAHLAPMTGHQLTSCGSCGSVVSGWAMGLLCAYYLQRCIPPCRRPLASVVAVSATTNSSFVSCDEKSLDHHDAG